MAIYDSIDQKISEKYEIRKIQALTGERSFTFVLPKHFAVKLGIEKGNFLKCWINENKLIVEKVI